MPYIDPVIKLDNLEVVVFRTCGGVRIINLTQHNLILDDEVIPKPNNDLQEYLYSLARFYEINRIGSAPIYNQRLDSCKAERGSFLDQLFDSEEQYDYVIISDELRKFIHLIINLDSFVTSKFLTVTGATAKPYYRRDLLVFNFYTICDEEVE